MAVSDVNGTTLSMKNSMEMFLLWRKCFFILIALLSPLFAPVSAMGSSDKPGFIAFESGPVRPIAISPNGKRLFVTNISDNRLEIFDISHRIPRPLGTALPPALRGPQAPTGVAVARRGIAGRHRSADSDLFDGHEHAAGNRRLAHRRSPASALG